MHVYYQTFNRKRRAGNENDYGTPGGADKERRKTTTSLITDKDVS
jgi:hypothetical protein